MSVGIWQKQPVEIQAVKWDGTEENTALILQWSHGEVSYRPYIEKDSWSSPEHLIVTTLEGKMVAKPGDYIIRGVRGEFYPCDSSIFKETYKFIEPA